MRCSNCTSTAEFILDDPGAKPTYFCALHVPAFLKRRMLEGDLKRVSEVNSSRADEKPAEDKKRKPVPTPPPAKNAVEETKE